MNTPTLKSVTRLDSLPLDQTLFTPEGFLVDRPIVTTTGIFEYLNHDGSIRRELRLPEDVFDPKSLESYEGKPIIITHDAGLVTKDNVNKFQIGTILSEGYRSGDDVRAKIVIHNTDEMKACGFKELSLGYNLDLDETPGEWHGHHYDAIQRNIRINHLALVKEARAGEQARLNIDSRDDTVLKGGKVMTRITHHEDGVLSPEELAKAIEEYKARRAKASPEKKDEDDVEEVVEEEATEEAEEPAEPEKTDAEDKLEEAQQIIKDQDDDIASLFDIIDSLLAERDFKAKETVKEDEDDVEDEPVDEDVVEDEDDTEDENTDEDDTEPVKMNADSIDEIVRKKVKIGILGSKLNMDGLEDLDVVEAQKAVIKAVKPTVRLDGKTSAYIDAMFDLACEEVNAQSVKGIDYQKKQMFNGDAKEPMDDGDTSAEAARQRMIERRNRK
jgi:hypothetical protein